MISDKADDNVVQFDDFAKSQVIRDQREPDPDKAAKAIEIGRDLGTPPTVTLANYDEAERQHKALLVGGIFDANDRMQSFVNNNPMASKVSADDWGPLDAASAAIEKYRQAARERARSGNIPEWNVLSSIFKGFIHGLKEDALIQYKQEPEASELKRSLVAVSPLGVVDSVFALMNATVHGIAAGAGEAYVQAGGNPAWGQRLTRDFIQAAQVMIPEFARGGQSPNAYLKGLIKQSEALAKAEPWVKANQEPPVGLHPELDKIKIEQAKEDAKNFDEAFKAVDATATRARSADLTERFVAEHGDQEVGIPIEAAQRLYGDKTPVPGEGPLGFIPDIDKQYAQASIAGGDITTSASRILAHAEKEVVKELNDDMRLRPEGLTIEEGAELTEFNQRALEQEAKVVELQPTDPAVEGVRKQGGLTPEFHNGWDFVESSDQVDPTKGRKGEWTPIADNVKVFVPETLNKTEQALFKLVEDELNRIVPKAVEHAPALDVESKGGMRHSGVYQQYTNYLPVIYYSLTHNDPVQIARHEAIHHLRSYGFFTDAEWTTLKNAAKEEDWLSKERKGKGTAVRDRYGYLTEDRMLEEAIADEFSYWNRNPDSPTIAAKVFQKLRDFLNKIYEKVMELRSSDPQVADIFRRVESGEVGGRKPKPLLPEVFSKFAEKAQGELDVTRMEDKTPFKGGAGITTASNMKKLLEAARKVREADAEYMRQQGERLERKRQTREWQENEVEVEQEVRAELGARPDLAAWRYFKYGELAGGDGKRPKINDRLLSKEQRRMMPPEWLRRDGFDPDELAPIFGFEKGTDLVESLIATESQRGDLPPGRWWERLVKDVTNEAMLERFGDLDENILAAAKEHVAGQDTLNFLHEKTLELAIRAGAEFSLTKEQLKSWTEKSFMDMRMKGITKDKFFNTAGKSGRAVETALLSQDYEAALRAQQWQYYNTLYAKHAMELGKAQNALDRMARRFNTRERIESVPAEYQFALQQLLSDTGLTLKVSPGEIADGLAFHGYKSLDDFVVAMTGDGKTIDLPLGYKPKPLDQMTVREFYEFKDAMDSLYDWGREEQKINLAGDKRDFASFEQEVVDTIYQRPLRDKDPHGNLIRRRLYQLDATNVKMEELVTALDFREEMGPLWTGLILPFELAKAHDWDLKTKLTAAMKELKGFGRDWRKTLDEVIPQDFIQAPGENGPRQLTRWNLIKIILNFGNEENALKLAQGMASAKLGWNRIASEAETLHMHNQLEALIHTHARKEDLQFAQHIWDIFGSFRPDIEAVTHATGQRLVKWVEPRPIQHAMHGEFKGGYFPLFANKDIPLGDHPGWDQRIGSRGLLDLDNYRFATTPKRHLRERTGATYWVDIESQIDQVAGEMQRQIHDIAYREAVINASKILNSKKIERAVKMHYGSEYWDQFRPWVEDIANNANAPERELGGYNWIFRQLRLNLTAAVLPLNYTVMFSPSVGTANPMAMARFWRDRAKHMDFAMEKSNELRHLMFNFDRDFSAVLDQAISGKGWSEMQAKMTRTFFAPLLKMEQELRAITWVQEYNRQLAEHGDDARAVLMADKVMRQRHGATSIVDQTALSRNPNEFVKAATMFMSFFDMTRNWARGLPDAYRQGRYGDMATIMWGTIGTAMFMNAALFNRKTKESNLGTFDYWAKALLATPFQMFVGSNWAWNSIAENQRPTSPLFRMIESGVQVGKDIAKSGQYGKKAPKHPIKDIAMAAGVVAGIPGAYPIGRAAQFGADWAQGVSRQQPANFVEFLRGLATGEAKLRKK